MGNESYSSRIIKAGALLEDTKVLLLRLDEAKTAEENLAVAKATNILGKISRSRVEDVLTVMRTRYFKGNGTAIHLHRLIRGGASPEIVDRLLYYHAALADALLYAFVAEHLFEKHRRGDIRVALTDVVDFIQSAIRQGRTETPWSEYTKLRVARGLLSALRDFRILEGAVHKRFAPVVLPIPAFVYVAFRLRQQLAGIAILQHPDWRLFFLGPGELDRHFIQAQQDGYLRYESLGQIVRIEFPFASIAELIDDLVARRPGDALG